MSDTYVLPPVKTDSDIELLHFPTRLQAFIFRNWELVPADKLAKVLKTDVGTVCDLAYEMGLAPQIDVSLWIKRGYITVIKQNWHILPYEQLLELLDWNAEKLAYILKEDDFLSAKLGDFKFDCKPLYYTPLTDDEHKLTACIAQTVKSVMKDRVRPAFDFFAKSDSAVMTDTSADGVLLTDQWKIVNHTDFSRADLFAKRFCDDVKSAFNLNLSGDKYHINIEKADIGDKPESHRITVKSDSITISSVDEAGVLRAFVWLYDKMCANSGPVVPRGEYTRIPRFNTRMIYSYHGLYGNVFDEDIEVSYSDEMFAEYARLGVNGIWAQGVLYKLVEFPFDPTMSTGYEKRQENLRKLIKKAADYGIKVYLYINEPRAMPLSFFDKYPNLKGTVVGDYAAMCTSKPEVRDYLKNAVADLCRAAEGLGGFFTITMSENLTNCWSRTFGNPCPCPNCGGRSPHDIIAEVNTAIFEGANSVDPAIRVFAWNWGWACALDFSDEECIKNLPDGVSVMCNSEEAMEYTIAGIKNTVIDYTMSLPTPGKRAKEIWSFAKKYRKPTAAKIQINDTWECSTVPYIPVFGLVKGHIERLSALGVDNLMLSWTLGGAPSPNIKITSQYFFDGEEQGTDMISSLYGENADTVRRATALFDKAFVNFPFCWQTVYYGPQFTGPANLLFSRSSGLAATMTGYPYDDVKLWSGPFTPEILENQFKMLSEIWAEGLQILKGIPQCELTDVATACYDLFLSSYNQIKFVRLRESGQKDEILKLLSLEEELSKSLYEITLRQSMIGYEAANHYVITPQMCLERVLNCQRLRKEFE